MGLIKVISEASVSWSDVGFHSVWCEYISLPLVNKEAACGQWHNRTELDRKN